MTKVLITGGGGYLGSVLVGHLLRRGYRVTVFDDLLYGQYSLIHYCSDSNFEFVRGEVPDETFRTLRVRASETAEGAGCDHSSRRGCRRESL